METVTVVDYGASNLYSVKKALEHVADGRQRVVVTDDHMTILAAERVVFPGQGAIAQCMRRLQHTGLADVLRKAVNTRPFLGICLGLQLLLTASDEDGDVMALGIVPGRVLRFSDGARGADGGVCKIPHIGWNRVMQTRPHPLWQGIADGAHFYFVHSYYMTTHQDSVVAATTHYAATDFVSALATGSLFATQFHPEKSQHDGLRLLKNFLAWDGSV